MGIFIPFSSTAGVISNELMIDAVMRKIEFSASPRAGQML
jgi:hypothetical protein